MVSAAGYHAGRLGCFSVSLMNVVNGKAGDLVVKAKILYSSRNLSERKIREFIKFSEKIFQKLLTNRKKGDMI